MSLESPSPGPSRGVVVPARGERTDAPALLRDCCGFLSFPGGYIVSQPASSSHLIPGADHMEKPKKNHDSDEALQDELRRESAEVSDVVGDIAEDRNVSGSSTWTTLPENEADDN